MVIIIPHCVKVRVLISILTPIKGQYNKIKELQNAKRISKEVHKKRNKKLQEENEKLHHYKTLYQSLKRQKEELRSWLVEQEERAWDEVSSTFGYVLDKLEELEGVSNE